MAVTTRGEGPGSPGPLSARGRSIWPLLVAGLVCLTLTFGAYSWVRNLQHERIATELNRYAVTYRTLFQGELHSYFNQIDALGRFLEGVDHVGRSEFAAFVNPVIEHYPAIRSFVWLPRVPDQLRESFEKRSFEKGLGERAIYAADTAPTVAAGRASLSAYPVTYIEPLSLNQKDLGLDLSADPAFDKLFTPLARRNDVAVIPNISDFPSLMTLFKDTKNLSLIIRPVYGGHGAWAFASPDDKMDHLRGYIILAFDLGDAFENSISGIPAGGMDVDLIDVGNGGQHLYHHPSRAKDDGTVSLISIYLENIAVVTDTPVKIKSARWKLVSSPVPAFYAQNYQWEAEFTLVLGLLVTTVLLLGFHSIQRKFWSFAKVVDDRTESLEASQREQISTLESINDIFFTVGVDWNILYANPKAEQFVGKSDSELRGKNLWDELPELASFFYRPLYQVMKSRLPLRGTLLPYPSNNMWFMLRAYPHRAGLSIYLLNVTKEESERKQREQAERRTQAILETTSNCVITIDARGTVQSINPAGEKMFGYTEDLVIGENIGMLMPGHERKHHDGYLRNYIWTGEQKIIGIGREVEGVRANGEVFPIHLSVSRMVVGDSIMFAGTVQDITDQKAALREIIEAKEAAEVANRAKTSFLNSMGHELRTPLNAVIGFSQLLTYAPNSQMTEKQQEYIRDITASGELLLELVNQVLDLSSIEAGKVELKVDELDIRNVVQEAVSIARAMALKKNVTLVDLVSEGGAVMIRSDALRLKQVILNLLSNAVKYGDDNGTVSISVEKSLNRMVQVRVTDDGPGIPESQFERIFEPFDRLGREAHTIEGTGIGLTIVRHLMDVLGGRVGLTSKMGDGSTFWIELPLIPTAISGTDNK